MGRPGARLSRAIGVQVAKDKLLRLRRLPDHAAGPVRFLGVDDFALRKGHSYATVLVDLETRCPVDVLPGRDADPLAEWLRDHPEGEVICRDRAGAYADGARTGAPQARRVADAWHLWRNLAEAVEKTVGTHHHCIREAFTTPPVPAERTCASAAVSEPRAEAETLFVPPGGTLDVLGRPRRLVARAAERYKAVQNLLIQGMSLTQISRELRLDHSTVRRFARASSLDDPPAPPPVFRPAPKPRRVVRWIMSNPQHLAEADATELKEIRTACPHLDATARHVRDFAAMMHDLRGE